MHLSLFRRRPIDPADLPPVSAASVPGPMHSGLTADAAPAPVPAPGPTVWPAAEPPMPFEDSTPGLAPLRVAPPLWRPGHYTVTYDRVGDLGRRGRLPAPAPLTTEALTAGDLARAVADDVRLLTGLTVSTVVDQAAAGGHLVDHSGRIGTFTYQQRGDER